MEFWALLLLALLVLWAQGILISYAAIQALRTELHTRWGAWLDLERLRLGRLDSKEIGHVTALETWRGFLNEESLSSEDAGTVERMCATRQAVAVFFSEQEIIVLSRRCARAFEEYRRAAAAYNLRLNSRLVNPFAKLMGHSFVRVPE